MSQIMKAFTGILMVLFMLVSATGILGAFFQSIYAQNLHAAIIHELENSDYAYDVLTEVFQVAEENAYRLEITLFTENDGLMVCTSPKMIPEQLSEVTMAKVELWTPLRIAFFEIDREQKLIGYAR